MFAAYPVKPAHTWHVASPAELDVIATRKIVLAVALPPRHIHVHAADAIIIVRTHCRQLRKIPGTLLPTESVRYLPTTPDEFASPLGKSVEREFSSRRAVSQELAATTNAFAWTRISVRVDLSV